MKVNPRLLDASIYPFSFDMPSRFSDVDSQKHLNNSRLTEFYQESRVAFYTNIERKHNFKRPDGHRFLVAHIAIDYLAEVNYPQMITMRVGIAKIGRTSQTLQIGLFSEGRCAGLARVVLVSGGPEGPMPISDEWRGMLSSYLLPADVQEQ